MQIYLSLLVCIIGALTYAFATNGRITEIGRLSFAVGLFVFLLKWDAAPFGLIGR